MIYASSGSVHVAFKNIEDGRGGRGARGVQVDAQASSQESRDPIPAPGAGDNPVTSPCDRDVSVGHSLSQHAHGSHREITLTMAPRPPARKQRRVVEDDDIEEGSSQPSASKSASVKKERSSGKGKARRDPEEEDEPEDEPQDEEEEEGDALMHQEIVSSRLLFDATGVADSMRTARLGR